MKRLSFVIIGISILISGILVARAQTPATSEDELRGISFPVVELGNCKNKTECKTYCDDTAHMEACVAFAEKHGLMNKDDASRARQFKTRLEETKGPGGCSSPKECEAVCSDFKNIEACIKFAEENGVKKENYESARKLSEYLKAGGTAPGGCNSKQSCETYCRDFNHADECLAFAEKTGTPRPDGPQNEQVRKLAELVKKGETPGGCASKTSCEAYCRDQSHAEECLNFAQKFGSVSAEQAKKIREQQGKGPGGCTSPEACKAFCAAPENHDACFKFAEERGFVKKEQAQETKDGFVQLKSGFSNMPSEVVACIKSTVGENLVEDIQAGKTVPGPEIGERVKSCFEKFGGKREVKDIIKSASSQVQACLKENLGDTFPKIASGEAQATPEIADTFRICSQKAQLADPAATKAANNDPLSFLRGAPPQVEACAKQKLGEDFERIRNGISVLGVDVRAVMKSCFESFQPPTRPQAKPGPEEALKQDACLRARLTEEEFKTLQMSSRQASPEILKKAEGCFLANTTSSTRPVQPPPTINKPIPQREPLLIQPQSLPFTAPKVDAQFPDLVRRCINANLDENDVELLGQGKPLPAEAQLIIRKCIEGSLPVPDDTIPPGSFNGGLRLGLLFAPLLNWVSR